MNIRLCLLLLSVSVPLVLGACNLGLGNRENNEFVMYTLHASKEALVAQNMTLVFDYQVSPVDTAIITYVQISTFMESNCVTTIAADIPLSSGFKVTMSTTVPVQAFSGTATIYGIRRGN